jgi:hypothetical protein
MSGITPASDDSKIFRSLDKEDSVIRVQGESIFSTTKDTVCDKSI